MYNNRIMAILVIFLPSFVRTYYMCGDVCAYSSVTFFLPSMPLLMWLECASSRVEKGRGGVGRTLKI
jgi:hypothetical protein